MGADVIWCSVKWKPVEKAAREGTLHDDFFDEEADEPGEAFAGEEIEFEHEALTWLGAWWPMMGLTEEFLKTSRPRPPGFEEKAALLRQIGILWGQTWDEHEVTAGATGMRRDLQLLDNDDADPPFTGAISPESLRSLAKQIHDEDWSSFIAYLDEIRTEEDPTGESRKRPDTEELAELIRELPEFLEALAEHERGVLTYLAY
jgi:hypothetical protein